MDNSTYEVRLAHWIQVVKAANSRPQGQLLRDWLSEHDISKDQYYYWQRKVRQEAYKASSLDLAALVTDDTPTDITFAEIPVINDLCNPQPENFSPDAIITIKGCKIELSNNTSQRLINALLEVLKYA